MKFQTNMLKRQFLLELRGGLVELTVRSEAVPFLPFVTASLYFPWVKVGRVNDDWGDEVWVAQFWLPTGIGLRRSSGFWSARGTVVGLGFGFSYQNDF